MTDPSHNKANIYTDQQQQCGTCKKDQAGIWLQDYCSGSPDQNKTNGLHNFKRWPDQLKSMISFVTKIFQLVRLWEKLIFFFRYDLKSNTRVCKQIEHL